MFDPIFLARIARGIKWRKNWQISLLSIVYLECYSYWQGRTWASISSESYYLSWFTNRSKVIGVWLPGFILYLNGVCEDEAYEVSVTCFMLPTHNRYYFCIVISSYIANLWFYQTINTLRNPLFIFKGMSSISGQKCGFLISLF